MPADPEGDWSENLVTKNVTLTFFFPPAQTSTTSHSLAGNPAHFGALLAPVGCTRKLEEGLTSGYCSPKYTARTLYQILL